MLIMEFNPEVKWLLMDHSTEKFYIRYLQHRWLTPAITKRPPYYAAPRYTPYYPLI